jgi:GntR family transcriptional regulator/MocR family aminotransferase
MLLLRIDPASAEPLYRQVARQIVGLVEGGALKEGEALPSSRELAAKLGLSRFTVASAYRELWAKGYVEARPGSYTKVRKRPRLAGSGPSRSPAAGPEFARISERARAALSSPSAAALVRRSPCGEIIDFAPMTLDNRIFPLDELRSCFSRSVARRQSALLNYCEPGGYLPLREDIASRMRMHGIETSPEEVLVTHGSLQGLELATKLLVDPGDRVAVEDPTFAQVLPLFRLHGARIEAVPIGPAGLDLEALARASGGKGKRSIALVYSIPSFHNPTGVTTSQAHRERLLALCEERGVPLVEDGFQEEITYFGKTVLPVKSMDASGIVIYLGSFSKVLFPGLRLGWAVARREWIERMAGLKAMSDVSCSPLVQAALHRFFEGGHYDRQLRRVNRVFAKRMRKAVAALGRHLPPARASFAPPSGGYLLWIRVDAPGAGEDEVLAALERSRVSAAPGSLFFAEPPKNTYLRLSISSLDEAEIEEGARRLGEALRSL